MSVESGGESLQPSLDPTANSLFVMKEVTLPSPNTTDNEIDQSHIRTNVAPKSNHESLNHINLYNDHHSGPYMVFVESISDNHNLGSLHPMSLGRLFYENKIPNIKQILRKGRNRVQINFTSNKAANNFLLNPLLTEKHLKAYIPSSCVNRVGVIRGVDRTLSEKDILTYIESSVPVISVQRMNRRSSHDGITEYIPTGTVKVVFECQILPQHVSIFNVITEVQAFIFSPTICLHCQRYGHTTKNCRSSSPRCSKCSLNHSSQDCSQTIYKCINCSGNHPAGSERCPEHIRQKELKKLMSIENKSYAELKNSFSPLANDFNTQLIPQQFPPLPTRTPTDNTVPAPRKRKFTAVVNSSPPRPVTSPGFDIRGYQAILASPKATKVPPVFALPSNPQMHQTASSSTTLPISQANSTPTLNTNPQIQAFSSKMLGYLNKADQDVTWRHIIKSIHDEVLQLISSLFPNSHLNENTSMEL